MAYYVYSQGQGKRNHAVGGAGVALCGRKIPDVPHNLTSFDTIIDCRRCVKLLPEIERVRMEKWIAHNESQ